MDNRKSKQDRNDRKVKAVIQRITSVFIFNMFIISILNFESKIINNINNSNYNYKLAIW